jgi:hypothetical protein
MPGQTPSGGFEPFNEAHAIVSSTITVQFSSPIADVDWPALRGAIVAADRDLELGAPQPYFGLSLTFDPTRVGAA